MSRDGRIGAIDAARGSAMALVCVSHVKQHFALDALQVHWLLEATTRVATPTFLLLSGFVIGRLLRTGSRGNAAVALVDRALFLLVVAHALLGLDDLFEQGALYWLTGRVAITDAIAIALLLAVLLRAASARTLTWLGASACIGSWFIAMTVTFHGEWAGRLAAILFNSPGAAAAENPGATLALIPYVGLFLLGMALSLRLEPALEAREERVLVRQLFRFALGALCVVAIGIMAWVAGKHLLSDAFRESDAASILRQTLDPRSKQPPSPAYFLFYGAAGLLLLAAFFHGRPAWLVQPVARVASVIGRASLFCFVIQDWLLHAIPKLFGFYELRSLPFWFAYLALCLLVLWLLAKWWDAKGGNRFFTIGLKALIRDRLEAGKAPGLARGQQPGCSSPSWSRQRQSTG